MMSLSVLVLNYNSERYLEDCLQSLLSQTLPADQILFCDDASTDKSVELASLFDSKIQVLASSFNRGPLFNCLYGLKHAYGDIVCFLDSDDIWDPKKLELVYSFFCSHPDYGLVSHSHIHVNADNKLLDIYDSTHRNIRKIRNADASLYSQSRMYKSSIVYRKGGFWLGSAYSFRRNLLDIDQLDDLLKGNASARYAYADLVIAPYLCLTQENFNVGYIHQPLLRYRRHFGNATPASTDLSSKLASLARIRHTNTCTLNLYCSLSSLYPGQITQDLLSHFGLKELEYDYQLSIYSGERVQAILLFARLISYFISENVFLKELKRICAAIVFGPAFLLLGQYKIFQRKLASKCLD